MTFKAFIFGMLGTFGFPWLVAIVIPFSTMRSKEPVTYEDGASASGPFMLKRSGRITEGSRIYGQEGCYQCHTQVVRPTYAGNDVHRDEWAGLRQSADVKADTHRETLPVDFAGEKVAHIGQGRVGPDLSNLGRRLDHHLKGTGQSPEGWLLRHLYNPRGVENYRKGTSDLPVNSTCPSKLGLFNKIDSASAKDALQVDIPEGKAIVPTDRARALASYLASLKKDTLEQPLPEAYNYNPSSESNE